MNLQIGALSAFLILSTFTSIAQGQIELEIIRSVRVSFPTDTGKQYQIFTTTDVAIEQWSPLGESIDGNGEIYTFHHDSEDPDKTFFKVEDIGIK